MGEARMTLNLQPSGIVQNACHSGRGGSPFHAVCLYQEGDQLNAAVAVYLAQGFIRNVGALVIATADHSEHICAALRGMSFSIERLRAGRELVFLDADTVLQHISVNDVPDPLKLRALIGQTTPLRCGPESELRIYSEMTERMHERGHEFAARRLEQTWGDCVADQPWHLLCGQHDSRLAGRPRRRLCAQHTHVIGPNGLPHPATGARSIGRVGW